MQLASRGFWGVALCALFGAQGCGKIGYEGPFPNSGGGYRRVDVAADKTKSVVRTGFAMALRYHGGNDQDGWISVFRDGVGGEEDKGDAGLLGYLADNSEYFTGRVVAAQGAFADEASLCQRLWVISGGSSSVPGAGEVCHLITADDTKPAGIADCAATSFAVQAVAVEEANKVADLDFPDADIFVDDGCGGTP